MSELELTINRRIPAPREKVFKAWLEPEMMAKFMRPPFGGVHGARAKTDAVKGGRFEVMMLTPDKELPHTGTYLEIDPHSRLSFTWESASSLDDSVVTIDFAEPEAGVTDVTLHQVKFKSVGERDGHTAGWTAILELLEENVA